MCRRSGRRGRRPLPGVGAPTVELVGKVGNDGAGDAVVVALGRLGIGHAALLRDPARPTPVLAPAAAGRTDAADVDARAARRRGCCRKTPTRGRASKPPTWNWRFAYLPQAGVIVLADAMAEAATAAGVEGAAFSSARLVVVVPAGAAAPLVPAEAVVLEAPADDDGSFGRLVGVFAGALDAGVDPAAAFAEAVSASGWERTVDVARRRGRPRAGVAGRPTGNRPLPVECRAMDRATDGLNNAGATSAFRRDSIPPPGGRSTDRRRQPC